MSVSARLSPAASLLRNSKLFALPPTIALPAAPPSSDQISSSDTATTVHPQFAAIETTTLSGNQGDWGFKRPLPLKATQTTGTPIVRLVRGIDTPEHVADFESAADHAITARKFQELNHPLRHPQGSGARNIFTDRMHHSVFRASHDNTTNLSASSPARAASFGVWPNISPEDILNQLPESIQKRQRQATEAAKIDKRDQPLEANMSAGAPSIVASRRRVEQRRWRYGGPSLTQISGMEFDEYLHKLGQKERDMLNTRVRKEIVHEKLIKARDAGDMDKTIHEEDVTAEEVKDYMRYLRNEPRKFGPIITEILDLPEVAPPKQIPRSAELWEYGRDTLAAPHWRETGPPKTHPSAGLSYVHTDAHATNHPSYGPQKLAPITLARAVKTRYRAGSSNNETDYGVAGFIVPKPDDASTFKTNEIFTPKSGGLKVAVRPGPAFIQTNGTLNMKTRRFNEYLVVDDKAVDKKEYNESITMEPTRQTAAAPRMSGYNNMYQSRTETQPGPSRIQRGSTDSSQDVDAILAGVQRRRPRV